MTFGNPWDCKMLRNSNVSCVQTSSTGKVIGNSQGADHFEAKRAVDQEENQVDDLAYVDHGVEVIVALNEG